MPVESKTTPQCVNGLKANGDRRLLRPSLRMQTLTVRCIAMEYTCLDGDSPGHNHSDACALTHQGRLNVAVGLIIRDLVDELQGQLNATDGSRTRAPYRW